MSPTEAHLTWAESLLAEAVEASADAVVCQDLDGRVRTWNAAAAHMYGFPSEQALGSRRVLFHDTAEALDQARQGQRIARFDTRAALQNGSDLDVSVTLSPLRDDHGRTTGTVTFISDISERIQLARELAQTREALEQHNTKLQRSNRNLEQFAYVASHDLSEPLRVMTGFVQLLEGRYPDVLDERGRRYMQHIVDAADRMRLLIDDLLEYSRFLRAERSLAPVDTSDVVKDVLQQLPAHEAEIRTEEPLPWVSSEPNLLGSVLQNLLSNALKFQHPGRAPRVNIHAKQYDDGTVELVVDDSGIGIEPAYREKVFQMFKRLHVREDYPGTGIGLAIAQQIVELHEGRIWVADSPLGGASFHFTMPAAGAAA